MYCLQKSGLYLMKEICSIKIVKKLKISYISYLSYAIIYNSVKGTHCFSSLANFYKNMGILLLLKHPRYIKLKYETIILMKKVLAKVIESIFS